MTPEQTAHIRTRLEMAERRNLDYPGFDWARELLAEVDRLRSLPCTSSTCAPVNYAQQDTESQ